MKLTNYIRDAFIKSVMADVPFVDYTEQARKLVQDDIFSQLPATIQKAFKDSATRAWVRVCTYEYLGFSVAVPSNVGEWTNNPPSLTEAGRTALAQIRSLYKEQETSRKELSARLRGAAYGCNTRKALAELIPEFDKYLPPEEEKTCRSLPVVANLMTDFMKAGWPKGQKPEPAPATAKAVPTKKPARAKKSA